MERLTKRWGNNTAVPGTFDIDFVFAMDDKTAAAFMDLCNRLADYEDTGMTPDEITALAKAIREERVLVLPCPIGTPVYVHERVCSSGGSVTDCKYGQDCPRLAVRCPYRVVKRAFTVSMLKYMGRSVWLTPEEAEAAIPANRRR